MRSGGGVEGQGWMNGLCFNDTATTEIYTLSLHDALPISSGPGVDMWIFGVHLAGISSITGAIKEIQIGRAHV